MAQTQTSENNHPQGAPPPYSEDPKMSYQRSSNKGDSLEPSVKKPTSRHSSVGSDNGKSAPDVSKLPKPSQPIGEAVEHAFDQAHVESYSQDLIAQITKNVIQELNRVSPEAKTKFQPPPPQQVPHSPPSTQASPPPVARDVYTPPSPHKHGEYPTNFGSPESRTSMPVNGPTSPRKEGTDKDRPTSRLSSVSDASPSRPGTAEETTLERIWGPLFDADGVPTKRLGQFLRGIAEHIIQAYEPKDSLVITPEKMEEFYMAMKIPKEVYPWRIVFDDENSQISRMYRRLECKHHLVQDEGHFDEKPDIPGLTPQGFELWETMMIQAHPEEEFQRLQKAACQLPINNPDDKKERFPKDISRRLFPSTPDLKLRGQLVHAIEQHCHCEVAKNCDDVPLPREPLSPRSNPGSSFNDDFPAAPGSSNIERERNPYSTSSTQKRVIDDLSTPGSKPIERERKPYRAAPGGVGRVYEEERPAPETRASEPRLPAEARAHGGLPPPPPGGPTLQRHNSIAQSRPINIPPPPVGSARQPPSDYLPENYHQGSNQRSFRDRAPSPGSDWGRKSEPDISRVESSRSDVGPGGRSGNYDRYEDDHYNRNFASDVGRSYGRGPSPGRRLERADTVHPGEEMSSRRSVGDRRSMYDTGEEYYRARASTVGSRGAW